MKAKSPLVLLLTCSAIVFAYVVGRIGSFLPKFFEVAYRLKPSEVASFMHIPTRFASENPWAFGLAMIFILAATVVALRRQSARDLKIAVVSLCAQGTIVWIAMFCFCYEGFCGPMGLHAEPEFSFVEFMRFEGSVFPISFAGLVTPIIFLIVAWRPANAPSEQMSRQTV